MPTLATRIRTAALRALGAPADAPDPTSEASPIAEPMPAGSQDASAGGVPNAAADAIAGATTYRSETVLTGPGGAPVWTSAAGPFPPDRAFDYGTIDGSREIDKVHFEGYLEQSVDEELAQARVAEADTDADLWRRREAEALGAGAAVVAAEAAVAAAETEATRAEAAAAARVARAEGERDRLTTEAETVEAGIRALRGSRGSKLYAWLYTLAAIVFVVGDIGIAQSTVADGLELTGWHGVVFAIGLGLLSVLLKPVYDRLIEDPYHDGEPRLFKRVITTVSVLTLGALLVLGYFRSESYVAGKNAERASLAGVQTAGEIDGIRNDPTLSPAERGTQIARLEAAQMEAIGRQEAATASLTTSSSGRLAFILSGVLFAVAGAVCLGIGLKHVSDWHYLRRVPAARAVRLRADATAQGAQAEAVARPASDTSGMPALRAAAEAARVRAETAWPVDTCRAALASALERRLAGIEGSLAARREKLVHLYRDGYELGLKNPADYDSDVKGGEGTGPSRRRRERPFVELRRAIARQSFGDAPQDPSMN